MRHAFFVVIAIFVAATSNAQTTGITWANNYDTCSGHRFWYGLVAPTVAGVQYRMEHAYGDGTTDTTLIPANSQDIWRHHGYGLPGTYTSKAVFMANNARIDSATQSFSTGSCVLFHGKIYADINNNCTFNGGIDGLIPIPLSIQVDSANIPVDTISAYGQWIYMQPVSLIAPIPPTTYKFTILNPPPTIASTCQTAHSITVNYPLGQYLSNDFGYTCTGTSFDASGVYSARLRTSNAGPSWISGWYYNIGCTPQSGTVTFKVSPKYSINATGVQPSPASISGNTITWNYTNLHLGTAQQFYIPVTANAVYAFGDTACNLMTVNPMTGDANPANNIISRCDSLFTGFDPNDKSVSPAGNIAAGTTLTYHINFENKGNDTAFNIHILDTLSPNLDAASLAIVSASHAVWPSLTERAGKQILKFDFPNIRLADSTHPLANKGYVRFTMRAKSNLAIGTYITNRAGIYFDYNPVVLTNTVTNYINAPQSVSVMQAAPRNTIHPNPASDRLIITNADSKLATATLMNTTGQTLRHWTLAPGENNVSISALPAGVYFVHLQGASGIQVEKLEKR